MAVTDGAYLKGALVRVPELRLEAVTPADGRFVFSAVPAGGYELTVSYIGYPSHASRVDVYDGETTRHGVAFSRRMEEVVVYGQQTASTAAALNQ